MVIWDLEGWSPVDLGIEGWSPVDLGPEGATHESKGKEYTSSQWGLLPLQCRWDTEIVLSLAEP